MALTSQQQIEAWSEMLFYDSSISKLFAKPDLQAAVAAADTWATNNATSYVAALPDPFKANSNASQKALLLAWVCMKRAGL